MFACVTEPELAPLAGLLDRLSAVVRRLPAPGGLSLATAATLNTLERYGPARLGELACSENVSQPGMTQLVARLEREGLAERRPDPHDGRAIQVAITAAGQLLVEQRRAARREQIARHVDAFDDEQRRILAAALPALERLADIAEQARADRLAPAGASA